MKSLFFFLSNKPCTCSGFMDIVVVIFAVFCENLSYDRWLLSFEAFPSLMKLRTKCVAFDTCTIQTPKQLWQRMKRQSNLQQTERKSIKFNAYAVQCQCFSSLLPYSLFNMHSTGLRSYTNSTTYISSYYTVGVRCLRSNLLLFYCLLDVQTK